MCKFVHRAQFLGDMPDPQALLAAVGKQTNYVPPATSSWWQRLQADRLHQDPAKHDTSRQQLPPMEGGAVRVVVGMLLAVLVYRLLEKGAVTGAAIVPVLSALLFGSAVLVFVYTLWQAGRQPPVRLYTPQQIDKSMVEAGNMECDCGGVMAGISFSGDSGGDGRDNRVTVSCQAAGTVDPDLAPLALFTCYLREFLARPHPLVGRPGPVCPFIPKSLQWDTIYMGVVHGALGQKEVAAVVRRHKKVFEKLEPSASSSKGTYKALILIFPDVTLAEAAGVVDGAQRLLKLEFVRAGLMVGEFHLNNNGSGLHNGSFYPLRTPLPSIAMRNMVPSDIAFLKEDQEMTEMYLSQFTADTRSTTRPHVKVARQALEGMKNK